MSEFFTSQTRIDAETILKTCEEASRNGPDLKFLEIGVFGGSTARGIKDWCDRNHVELDYWGIDNGSHPGFTDAFQPGIPFLGANFMRGDSIEIPHLLPNDFCIVLLDGCHCFNHVVMETVRYRHKVRAGGFLIYHDTSPTVQHMHRDPHGPDNLLFYNSVNLALEDIGWPWAGWKLVSDVFDPDATFGGIRVYQKI